MKFNLILQLPRMPFSPKRKLPNVIPKPPTLEQLKAPIAEQIKYPSFPIRKQPPPHIRLAQPPKPQRHITDVETARPLPCTFKEGESKRDYNTKPLKVEALAHGEYHYPYRYYEIALRRGIIGLPARTKHIVQSLGLQKRHQVVWRMVSPRSAGQILKIKELVTVRLVNEVPTKEAWPTGFTRVGNIMNQ
jgi:large subunit ribosomal protein L30